MDEDRALIVLVIPIFLLSGYIFLSLLLCYWPNILWSKKQDRHHDTEDKSEDRITEFEKQVLDEEPVHEVGVENYVETTDQDITIAVAEVEGNELLCQENSDTDFEKVMKESEGKPTIVRVMQKDINQLQKIIHLIKEYKRQDSVIVGSDSQKTIHSLCKMDVDVHIYRETDWKLYLSYFIGLLPMIPFDPSILLITHSFSSNSKTQTMRDKLRQWVSNSLLIGLGPMICHLRRRGIRTYLICINKTDQKVPDGIYLILNGPTERSVAKLKTQFQPDSTSQKEIMSSEACGDIEQHETTTSQKEEQKGGESSNLSRSFFAKALKASKDLFSASPPSKELNKESEPSHHVEIDMQEKGGNSSKTSVAKELKESKDVLSASPPSKELHKESESSPHAELNMQKKERNSSKTFVAKELKESKDVLSASPPSKELNREREPSHHVELDMQERERNSSKTFFTKILKAPKDLLSASPPSKELNKESECSRHVELKMQEKEQNSSKTFFTKILKAPKALLSASPPSKELNKETESSLHAELNMQEKERNSSKTFVAKELKESKDVLSASPPSKELNRETESSLLAEVNMQEKGRNSRSNFPI